MKMESWKVSANLIMEKGLTWATIPMGHCKPKGRLRMTYAWEPGNYMNQMVC